MGDLLTRAYQYIPDLEEGITNFILKFADDTKVFGKVMDEKDKGMLQTDLNKLTSWAQKWKMEFNVAKCKVMHTGNKNNEFSYEMNGKVLDKVLIEKDLGIMISSDMKSSQQCVAACNKANRVLGMIRRTISYKEQWMMTNLYKSLVRPHLEQCVSVWSPHYQKDKELLEKVQHRFTRMIEGFSLVPYEERLWKLGLWTLEERRNRSDLIEVFKMFSGYTEIDIKVLFTLDGNDKGLRGHSEKICKVRFNIDVRKYFFQIVLLTNGTIWIRTLSMHLV